MQVGDKMVDFDRDGFMVSPELWDDEVARVIAGDEGIDEMSEEHWKIVKFIREYWEEHDLAPPVRLICKELGIDVRMIFRLFKSGPARGACRIAGLPRPNGCV
jgi:TusE/DsrC/DsvC family sulfur relay protein